MCDTLVALPPATAAGHTLFAKNSDRPPDEVQRVFASPPRRDEGALRVTHIEVAPSPRDTLACVLSVPTWCWGAEHGVNEAGVAIGNEAIYTTLDPRRTPPALIGMDMVRLGLERGDSARAALQVLLDLLERYGQGGTGHDPKGARGAKPYWSSFLIADAATAFVLETSGTSWMVEEVQGTRAISNRTSIAEFDALHRHPKQPVARRVDPRQRAAAALLAKGGVDVPGLQALLRTHDVGGEPGWGLCMHGRDDDGRLVETTTSSMIAELPANEPPRAWVLVGRPCEQEYVQVRVGEAFTTLQGRSIAEAPRAD